MSDGTFRQTPPLAPCDHALICRLASTGFETALKAGAGLQSGDVAIEGSDEYFQLLLGMVGAEARGRKATGKSAGFYSYKDGRRGPVNPQVS